MTLKLNWLGIHVSDFENALRFYTEVIGLNATDTKTDWAYFDTSGMTFELFGGGAHLSGRSQQAVRPGIQVADLRSEIDGMRRRGVQFTTDIEQTAWGEQIEFMGPENMRWTLSHAPTLPFGESLRKAHIGWIELKADRLAEQRAFYNQVLGLHPEDGSDGQVVLRQEPGEPILFLQTGGQHAGLLQINAGMFTPLPSHLMSVETKNIEQAAAWLTSCSIPILIGITRKSWGGIDLYITDADGNPIQVVQYI